MRDHKIIIETTFVNFDSGRLILLLYIFDETTFKNSNKNLIKHSTEYIQLSLMYSRIMLNWYMLAADAAASEDCANGWTTRHTRSIS